MSAFDVAVATRELQTIEEAMAPYQGTEWTYYAVGGRGWEPYAYIDIYGGWHSQWRNEVAADGEMGRHIPLEEWRHEIWLWINSLPVDTRVVMVRCKA